MALFDDHALMRDMIANTLATTHGIEVVARGQSADDAIRATEAQLPDVVLMDLNMPGNGIAASTAINTVFPAVNIIILTSDDSEHMIATALRAGAMAYVIKGGPMRDLIATVKDVADGQAFISPAFAENLLAPRALGAPWMDERTAQSIDITDREEQVLRRFSQGLTKEEIGSSIGLSPATVGKIISNVLVKLHAYERYEALRHLA